uniref:Uncharacterized protein n=1 Tax=Rhizophora mucronata TaxID=61149 RepID=A0A2P2IZP3_RHIMU
MSPHSLILTTSAITGLRSLPFLSFLIERRFDLTRPHNR